MKLNQKKIDKWFNYKAQIIEGKWVEFYDSDQIFRQLPETDIALIYSGRNRGKSFDIAAKALIDAFASDGKIQFGYARRYAAEINADDVEGYFRDKLQFIADITDGAITDIIFQGGKIYAAHDEDDKLVKDFIIGRTFAINTSRKYKSIQYPEINKLIIEEVFTDGAYAPDEPNKVLNLHSTIFRHRKGRTFLISNTVSRVNPYISDWALSNMYTQKPGTIDLYQLDQGEVGADGNPIYIHVACEYLKDALSEDDSDSKLKRLSRLLNKKILTSTLSNKWDEKSLYPVISNKFITQFDSITSVVFVNRGFKFIATAFSVPVNIQEQYENYVNEERVKLSTEYMTVIYIERKTTAVKYGTRVYSDEAIVSPYYTRGLISLYDSDMEMFKLIESGRAFYANNLIANEFSQCYRELKMIRAI